MKNDKKLILFYATVIIILIIIVVIYFKSCKKQVPETTETTTTREYIDTTYKTIYDTVKIESPKLKRTEQQPLPPKNNKTSSVINYEYLYDSLLSKYLEKKFYEDTVNLDSGTVTASNTVSENKLISSTYTIKNKFPVITKTVDNQTIKHEYDGRQLYLGAGAGTIGSFQGLSVNASIAYKDRKDNLTSFTIERINNQFAYSLTRYFKISFKNGTDKTK